MKLCCVQWSGLLYRSHEAFNSETLQNQSLIGVGSLYRLGAKKVGHWEGLPFDWDFGEGAVLVETINRRELLLRVESSCSILFLVTSVTRSSAVVKRCEDVLKSLKVT